MTLISATIEADFPSYTAAQQQAVVAKLRRYVERGTWAEEVLRKIGEGPAPAAGDREVAK